MVLALLEVQRGLTDNRCLSANLGRGKSELHRATQGVTPLRRKARNSGTERISEAMIFWLGTGDLKGAGGVKTAKLCVKQDQIGKRKTLSKEDLKERLVRGFRVRSLEPNSNVGPRGMIVESRVKCG